MLTSVCLRAEGRHLYGALALIASAGVVTACVGVYPSGDSPVTGVEVPWTDEQCRAPRDDRDEDGVDDACELALARAFAPELVVDPRDCSWDLRVEPVRLGGAYLFAVEATADRRAIRIAYVPAYFRDCGWEGPACMTRARSCAAHDGDSELIVVEAHYRPPNRWVTNAVFLSAHCLGRSGGRCRWYRGRELRHFTWADGRRVAPRIWVARGKHANYPSARECDTGHWYYDSCDGNSVAYRFVAVSNAQNIGSRHRPLPQSSASRGAGCLASEQLPLPSPAAEAAATECFWNESAPFRGWQRKGGGGATPYARLLAHAAEF